MLFYDDTCGMCSSGIRRIRRLLESHRIAVRPFPDGAAESEIKLHGEDGRILGGVDAILWLCRCVPIGWPIWIISHLPGVKPVLRSLYRRVAEHRHGVCRLPRRKKNAPDRKTRWGGGIVSWLPMAVLIAAASELSATLPAWQWMWLLAGALWLGCKLMMFGRAGGRWVLLPAFFLWVGMDTGAFARDASARSDRRKPYRSDPFLFVPAGLALLFAGVPWIENEILRGWTGFAAMLCLLHFGLFDLMGRGWNALQFPVAPLMDRPWLARGAADFWGRRWNRGFSDWARVVLFVPLVRRFGTVVFIYLTAVYAWAAVFLGGWQQ